VQSLACKAIWFGTKRKSRLKSDLMRFAEHCRRGDSAKWNCVCVWLTCAWLSVPYQNENAWKRGITFVLVYFRIYLAAVCLRDSSRLVCMETAWITEKRYMHW